ncbi:guanylate kinase [Paucilactobacillus sp. N302-9]
MKRIFVITGATGSGKTTVSNYLRRTYNMPKVITHTTRLPRTGEKDDRDYHFETPESMRKLHLLEKVQYDHHWYGSSMESLNKAWEQSDNATIVLDTKGAQTYHQELGAQAVIIFLTVTQPENLVNRLIERGDSQAALKQRVASREYRRDLQLPEGLTKTAHLIINDDWEKTQKRLDQLVTEVETNR